MHYVTGVILVELLCLSGVAAVAQGAPPAPPPATTEQKMFADVPPGHWAYDSVALLQQVGVLEGEGESPAPTTVEPPAPPNPGSPKAKMFEDVPEGHWAYNAVKLLAEFGVIED